MKRLGLSKKIHIITIAFLLILFYPGTVSAHLMIIEQVEEGLMVVRYDDGTRAARAEVTLYDEGGNVISEGKVDREGYYSYDPSLPLYRAVADDGMGHRASWVRGEESLWLEIPRWLRALVGVSIFLFIASYASYRSGKRKEG